MKLQVINTGFFKLDGGAMFGVVPKTIWKNLNPPDDNNLCTWAMRCLLIEEGKKLVLIDTGLGSKQDAKFFSHYEPHGGDNLQSSIEKAGYGLHEVTDVILTHLHFDHCGGAVTRETDGQLRPAFKNATYWSHPSHWQWATQPNAREKASFLKENFIPIQESGQLRFSKNESDSPLPAVQLKTVCGHTESMFIPHIQAGNTTIIYCADLFPSHHHIPLPYVMAYDTRPLLTLDEKKKLLDERVQQPTLLFFEHDRNTECCELEATEKGIRGKNFGNLQEHLI